MHGSMVCQTPRCATRIVFIYTVYTNHPTNVHCVPCLDSTLMYTFSTALPCTAVVNSTYIVVSGAPVRPYISSIVHALRDDLRVHHTSVVGRAVRVLMKPKKHLSPAEAKGSCCRRIFVCAHRDCAHGVGRTPVRIGLGVGHLERSETKWVGRLRHSMPKVPHRKRSNKGRHGSDQKQGNKNNAARRPTRASGKAAMV